MTVKDLISKLQQYPPDTIVLVDIHEHCSDFCAHAVKGVDNGFLPSGAISLTIIKAPITC